MWETQDDELEFFSSAKKTNDTNLGVGKICKTRLGFHTRLTSPFLMTKPQAAFTCLVITGRIEGCRTCTVFGRQIPQLSSFPRYQKWKGFRGWKELMFIKPTKWEWKFSVYSSAMDYFYTTAAATRRTRRLALLLPSVLYAHSLSHFATHSAVLLSSF